jgi:hypothetical protein
MNAKKLVIFSFYHGLLAGESHFFIIFVDQTFMYAEIMVTLYQYSSA